jgi:nitroimidazol reductase NimA-like FMN-containing flavoprotein (pyridoxamine 5'-phosphate oxidase superfamily)
MFRSQRQMPDADARSFLREQRVAHVATVDGDGWPYVIPLVFIYEGGDILYLHTGALQQGQFYNNVLARPRLSLEVCDMGPLHKGKTFACDSALVYTSIVLSGEVTIIPDRERKTWFFDRLLEKYGDPEWKFEPGYPALDRITLYEVSIKTLTGKRSEGLRH